jgi:RNA polymerase sigma-70 factor (ECF subfamily)
MATEKELSDFLAGIEKRGFKRAAYAVRNDDAALDLVQETMIKVAEKYGDRPVEELPLLFQRILSNAINDYFRREKVRGAHVSSLSDFSGGSEEDGGDFDLLEALEMEDDAQAGTESAADAVQRYQILQSIEDEIKKLPDRQREAFMLRYVEEMDVAETAAAMGCSEGSVKTHCSRATHALAKSLTAKGVRL